MMQDTVYHKYHLLFKVRSEILFDHKLKINILTKAVFLFPNSKLFHYLFQPLLMCIQYTGGLPSSSITVGCCQDLNESDFTQGATFKNTFCSFVLLSENE